MKTTSFYSFFSQAIWAVQAAGLFLLIVLSFFPNLFHLEEILFFSLFGLALTIGWLEGKTPLVRTPLDLPIILLLGWILLTIPFSLNPIYSFGEWRKLVAQIAVYYWGVFVVGESSQKRWMAQLYTYFKWEGFTGEKGFPQAAFLAVLLGSLVLSCLTLMDFINRGGNWQDRNIRAIVPGSDYNWLSTYGVLSIPIILYCGITARGLWGKVLSHATLTLAFLAHAASYTRAGWLASGVQFFTWGLLLRRQKFLAIFLSIILLISAVLLVAFQMGYHLDTFGMWTVETRLKVWKFGFEEMIRHPLFGIGYGNKIFQPILINSPMGEAPMHLHSAPLMVGVGTGFPGLLLFLWLFFRLGRMLVPKNTPKSWGNAESFRLCLGIVLVGFFFRNLFDYMFAGSLAYLFWILMACGIGTNTKKPIG